MPVSFLEVEPRSFNPMSVPGLTNEVREAVNAALKAMSAWRNEMADTSEKNGKQVIERMAVAAAALGWPEQIVEAARTQLQSISEMQIQTVDRMMDAWVEQLKLPNPMAASPSAMLSKLKRRHGLAKRRGYSKGGDESLAVLTTDAVHDEKSTNRRIQGRDNIIETWQGWAKAFPDSKATFVREVASGDTAILELVWKGVHSGPLQTPTGEIPATNKLIEMPACQVKFATDVEAQRELVDIV
jgi:hypothetical protein